MNACGLYIILFYIFNKYLYLFIYTYIIFIIYKNKYKYIFIYIYYIIYVACTLGCTQIKIVIVSGGAGFLIKKLRVSPWDSVPWSLSVFCPCVLEDWPRPHSTILAAQGTCLSAVCFIK